MITSNPPSPKPGEGNPDRLAPPGCARQGAPGTEVGGSSGRAAPLLLLGDPRAAGSAPAPRPQHRPPPPCRRSQVPVAVPGKSAQSQGKRDPPAAPEKGAQWRVQVSAGLSPTPPPPTPWPPRGGTFLTFLSFPQTSGWQNRRFPPDSNSAAPTSRLHHGHSPPPFAERGPGPPSRDDSLRSLPGGSHKSPPLRRPAQRSGAGALCRATRQEHPRDRARSRAEGVENMEPSPAQGPRAAHRGSPPSPAGASAPGPSWVFIHRPGPDPGGEDQPRPRGTHSRPESPHPCSRSSPAPGRCPEETTMNRICTSCIKTLERQFYCVKTKFVSCISVALFCPN
nr:PREDICTED: formin-like protein 5 [Equus przewalskii]